MNYYKHLVEESMEGLACEEFTIDKLIAVINRYDKGIHDRINLLSYMLQHNGVVTEKEKFLVDALARDGYIEW